MQTLTKHILKYSAMVGKVLVIRSSRLVCCCFLLIFWKCGDDKENKNKLTEQPRIGILATTPRTSWKLHWKCWISETKHMKIFVTWVSGPWEIKPSWSCSKSEVHYVGKKIWFSSCCMHCVLDLVVAHQALWTRESNVTRKNIQSTRG